MTDAQLAGGIVPQVKDLGDMWFDDVHEAWVVNGTYVGHTFPCQCWGCVHRGEPVVARVWKE